MIDSFRVVRRAAIKNLRAVRSSSRVLQIIAKGHLLQSKKKSTIALTSWKVGDKQ